MKLVFAGTPEFAAQHLGGLITAGHSIVGVYSQPDRPAGRGQRLHESPVKTLAKLHDLPVFQPQDFKSDTSRQQLAALQPDLMIVVAYGLLLPQSVLDIPRLGCINVHASLLPRWRGAAPIQRAIEAGDSQSGVGIMQMEAGLDTGPVLLESRIDLAVDETGASLHDKLARLGTDSLLACLQHFEHYADQAKPQDDSASCYARKLTKAEAEIDWSQPGQQIERRIRAFNPFPVAFTRLQGDIIKIWHAEFDPTPTDAAPGTLLDATRDGLLIATGNGCIRLLRLQPPGSRAMAIQDFLNGRALQPGLQLG